MIGDTFKSGTIGGLSPLKSGLLIMVVLAMTIGIPTIVVFVALPSDEVTESPPVIPEYEQGILSRKITVSIEKEFDQLAFDFDGLNLDQINWTVVPFTTLTEVELTITGNTESGLNITEEELRSAWNNSDANVTSGVTVQLLLPWFDEILPSVDFQLKLPINAETLCSGEVCIPVLCPLIYDYEADISVSVAVSNNELLFGSNTNCTIVKPDFWEDWLDAYFPPEEHIVIDYYGDYDSDGLSNIVEYYGTDVVSLYSSVILNTTGTTRRLQGLTFPSAGTDPTNADTDGDLLGDAFEWEFQSNPNEANSLTEDDDADGIDVFDEMLMRTNPQSSDTDKDGVGDFEELQLGSSSRNVEDSAQQDTMEITLTIGDPSGSHSERWSMSVGEQLHEARTFGEVETNTYTFSKGVYSISIAHTGSNLATPDYDYRALVVGLANPTLEAVVSDPEGILGNHFESTFNFALGKTAEVVVQCKAGITSAECSGFESCADIKSCSTCVEFSSDCVWSVSSNSCSFTANPFAKQTQANCPCKKCDAFASNEQDRSWIANLPLCPCTANFIFASTVPIGGDTAVSWSTDAACNSVISSIAGSCPFHPGARGCARANSYNSETGGAQQCCYNNAGSLIPPGNLGAGTPDRATRFNKHRKLDVVPFKNCCEECKTEAGQVDATRCNKYIGSTDLTTLGARMDERACAT